jgi:hypothetical protein
MFRKTTDIFQTYIDPYLFFSNNYLLIKSYCRLSGGEAHWSSDQSQEQNIVASNPARGQGVTIQFSLQCCYKYELISIKYVV